MTDINAGSGDSDPDDPVVYLGALYFAADDPVHGEELWKYDGTSASRVTDINTDSNHDGGDSQIEHLVVFDGVLYFEADDGLNDEQLWAYNADGWLV